jgi:AcrR family transcriptional regulator
VRRTKEQAAETRQTILRTAEVLFLQRGYESSSLDEIAVAAGVSRGAIHFHFHNKLGLLFAFRDELILPMQQLAQRLGGEATLAPLDALGDVIETTFVELQGKPAKKPILKLLKAIDADEAYDDVSNARYFRQQVRLALTEICEAAQRNGTLPAPWTARSAAIALYAMLDGLINEWFLDEVDLSLAPDGVAIIRSFLTSLTKPGRDLPAA